MKTFTKLFTALAVCFVLGSAVWEGLRTADAQTGGGSPPITRTGTASGWTVSSGCTTTPSENPKFVQTGKIVTVYIPGNSCTVSGSPTQICITGASWPAGISAPTSNNGYMGEGPGTVPAGAAQNMSFIWSGGVGFCVTSLTAAATGGTLTNAQVFSWNGQNFTYQSAL